MSGNLNTFTSNMLGEERSPWGKALVFPVLSIARYGVFLPWWSSVHGPLSLICSHLSVYRSTALKYCHDDYIVQNELSLMHCQCLIHWFDDGDKMIKNWDCSGKSWLFGKCYKVYSLASNMFHDHNKKTTTNENTLLVSLFHMRKLRDITWTLIFETSRIF